MSSLLPPGTCLQFLSRIGFSIPTARRFSSNVANSRSRTFRSSIFYATKSSYEYSYVHSGRIELAKLILVGTSSTYQATGDAVHGCSIIHLYILELSGELTATAVCMGFLGSFCFHRFSAFGEFQCLWMINIEAHWTLFVGRQAQQTTISHACTDHFSMIDARWSRYLWCEYSDGF